MWLYYLKLSWLSLKRTPVLSALMVLATAVGIGACLTTFSAFAVIASNPMSHKNETIFAVQLDSWAPNREYRGFNGLPPQITYRDAIALSKSEIPDKTVIMTKSSVIARKIDGTGQGLVERTRITSADFFSLFDVDFLYGGAWDKSVDLDATKVAIISESVNLALFNGADSVGESVLLSGESFTIAGVTKADWIPIPTVYDLNSGPFQESPGVYIPFSLLANKNYPRSGGASSWKGGQGNITYQETLQSETIWIQAWVELSSEEKINEFSRYIENYITQQKEGGRFQRPLNYLLSTPSQWLEINKVLTDQNRVLLLISGAFLIVCLLNTIVMLLAKFLRKASEAGVRRALGASQRAIFSQHLFEALIIGLLGGLLGLALSWLGLAGIRSLYGSGADKVAVFSGLTVIMSFVFALVASLLSGFLPAWKISHTQPASYLKTQ